MIESGNETCDLHNVMLEENEKQTQNNLKNKKPKRILKFSDGVLEEYSSEDETDTGTEKQAESVNPKKLNWLSWTSKKLLKGCDTAGEYLAAFLGITVPKYQFEIDEYYRLKAAREAQKKEDLEMGSWTEHNENNFIQTNEVK